MKHPIDDWGITKRLLKSVVFSSFLGLGSFFILGLTIKGMILINGLLFKGQNIFLNLVDSASNYISVGLGIVILIISTLYFFMREAFYFIAAYRITKSAYDALPGKTGAIYAMIEKALKDYNPEKENENPNN